MRRGALRAPTLPVRCFDLWPQGARSAPLRRKRPSVTGGAAGSAVARPAAFLLIALAAVLSACGPDWREYRSEAGKYSVEFPGGRPAERETQGRAAIVHLAHVEIDRTTAYGVSWFDVAKPAKPVAELLTDMQAEVLRDLKATARQASEIELPGPGGDAPGRAFTARTETGIDVSIRLYAAGADPVRVYQVIAAVPDAARAEGDIKRFFDSFKLLK